MPNPKNINNIKMKKYILFLFSIALFMVQCTPKVADATAKTEDTTKEVTKSATPPTQQTFRQSPPPSGPAPKIEIGEYETFTLDNGLKSDLIRES